MGASRWLTLSQKDGPAIRVHNHVYSDMIFDGSGDSSQPPSIIMFVGRREKSALLRALLGGIDSSYDLGSHSQVDLWREPGRASARHPVLFADSELHTYNPSRSAITAPLTGPERFRKMAWTSPGRPSCKRLAAQVCSTIIAPLSTVLCYFAADLGGIRGVASLLAMHIEAQIRHDLVDAIKPHVLVAVPTPSNSPDVTKTQTKLLRLLQSILSTQEAFESVTSIDKVIYSVVRSIHVHFLPPEKTDLPIRATVLRNGLETLDCNAREIRLANRTLFSHTHSQAFCGSLVDFVCQPSSQTFSFVAASRPHGHEDRQLGVHIERLLRSLPSEVWHQAVPFLGSCFLLISYPPGSHSRLALELRMTLTDLSVPAELDVSCVI